MKLALLLWSLAKLGYDTMFLRRMPLHKYACVCARVCVSVSNITSYHVYLPWK